ncbi:MAG: hypothetical protein ACFFG0_17405 [Candidatus Thorarchaeota archaeon]
MGKQIYLRSIKVKTFILFSMFLLFIQVFTSQVAADQLEDGPLKINSGDFINVQPGYNTMIFWNFTALTNERAIYWEIVGYGVYETGWGPNANCTTPVLNEEGTRYDYECHGYYAKYHVWSKMIVSCSETGQVDGGGDNNIPLILLLFIGIPVVSVCVVAIFIVIYLKRKKQKDFF